MTREEAFERFKAAARRVWRNADFALEVVMYSNEEPVLRPGKTQRALASVTYMDGRLPQAISSSILMRPAAYTLRIADRLLQLADADVEKVLVHEAVHLGIGNHGGAFREKVRQHGGTVSEESLDAPGTRVEVKEGARYKTLRTFESEREALAWGKEQQRLNPDKRYRLSIGT